MPGTWQISSLFWSLSPQNMYYNVSGFQKEVRHTFWPQSFYHHIGAGSSKQRRRGKLRRGCFGWTSIHFLSVWFRVKVFFYCLPNSIVKFQRCSCSSHFHCVFAFKLSLFSLSSSLRSLYMVIFSWDPSLPLRWWRQLFQKKKRKEKYQRQLDCLEKLSTEYWAGQERWASCNDRSGF